MQRKFIFSVIIVLVLVGGVVFSLSKRMTPEQIVIPQNTDTGSSHWKTYQSEDYGFWLKYPSNWTVSAVVGTPVFFLKSQNFKPVITGYDAENKETLSRGEIRMDVIDNPKNLSIKEKYLEFDDMSRLYFSSEKMKYQETKIKDYDVVIFDPFQDNNPNWKLDVSHKIIILKLQNKILSFDYTYTDSPNDEVMGILQEIANSVSLSR